MAKNFKVVVENNNILSIAHFVKVKMYLSKKCLTKTIFLSKNILLFNLLL